MIERRRLTRIAIISILFSFTPFIGIDHYVEDHEIGSGWNIFLKSSPSLKFSFSNPAYDNGGPDTLPFEGLDMKKKEEMRQFCKIRFWVDDIKKCYKILSI